MTTLSKDQAVIAGYQLVKGAAPSSSTYLALSQSYAVNGEAAIVAQIQGATAGLTNAQLGSLVVSNAGFVNRPDLAQYVADLLGIFGAGNRGQVVLNLAERLLSFTNDATYGAAATKFAAYVTSNINYAQSASSTTDRPTSDGVIASSTFTLTTLRDTANTATATTNGAVADNAGSIANAFRFTSNNETITGTFATLQASDSLVDSSTTDADVLNLALGTTTGTTAAATITNVETFNVTASAATGAAATTLDLSNVTGLKTLNISGASASAISFTTAATTGLTVVNASGLTNTAAVAGGAAASTTAGINGNLGASTVAVTVTGSAGADTITGGSGNDSILGGDGADSLVGGAGNDTLNGGAGDDVIEGGAGADVILGGAGADTISTGAGNDTVTGGAGNDVITLGAGNQTVVLEATLAANGNDVINTFTAGAVGTVANADVLNVSAFLGAAVSFNKVAAGVTTTGNVVVITDSSVLNGNVYAANAKIVVVAANDTVHYVTTDANGIVATDNTVATLTGVPVTDLVASNFA